MNRQQLDEAMRIALSNADLQCEIAQIDIFDGFGLADFKPVTVTPKQIAALIRWQCCQLNGGIDAEALTEIADCGRKRFIIVG